MADGQSGAYRELQPPVAAADLMAVSPDGRRLALASSQTGLYLWDLETGRLIHQVRERIGLGFIQFFRDSRLLVHSGSTFQILNKQLETLDSWEVDAGKPFHFDGQSRILSNHRSQGILTLDLETRQADLVVDRHAPRPSWYQRLIPLPDQQQKQRHQTGTRCFGYDGKPTEFSLAYYHEPSCSLLLKADEVLLLNHFEGEVLPGHSLRAIEPGPGATLRDVLRVWKNGLSGRAAEQIPIQALSELAEPHQLEIPADLKDKQTHWLALSPDQRWLLGEFGGWLGLWDLYDGSLSRLFEISDGNEHREHCYRLMFLDNESFVSQHSSSIAYWGIEPPRCLRTFSTGKFKSLNDLRDELRSQLGASLPANVSLVYRSANERFAVTVHGSRESSTLTGWDLELRREVFSFRKNSTIECVSLSDDERWMLVGSDYDVSLWDMSDYSRSWTAAWTQHGCMCEGIYFLDQERFLTTHRGPFVLWQVDSAKPLYDPDGILEPDGVDVPEAVARQYYAQMGLAGVELDDFGAEPASRQMISSMIRDSIARDRQPWPRMSELAALQQQSRYDPLLLSPDGRLLYAIYYFDHRYLHGWDLHSLEPLALFQDYTREVSCMALSADGARLLAGGAEITLWKLGDQRLEQSFACSSPCKLVQFIDRQRFVSVHADGSIRIQNLAQGPDHV
ncbi:MAG: hypothetical protein ACAI44_13860 [Candidatus Sericytochromatia bacterium]